MTTKECDICGIPFEARRSNQRYCPECRKNPRTKWNELNRAFQDSYARIEKTNYTRYNVTCKYCKKNFQTTTLDRKFCSENCKQKYNML